MAVTQDVTNTDGSPTAPRPVVPQRPPQAAIDPIMETLRTQARPVGQQPTFPPDAATQQPAQQGSPPIPQSMLQQPNAAYGIPLNGALGSLMTAVLNQQRDTDTKFYMLTVPDSAPPTVQPFDRIEDLCNAIKPQLGKPAYVYCFMGRLLPITAGPFHFLQTPYGAIPLHDVPPPASQEALTDGWVGQELPVTEFVRQSIAADEVITDDDDMEDPDLGDIDEDTDDSVPHDDTDLF